MFRFILTVVLSFIFLFSNAQQSPKHEFRGVWIASVVNIDWPSKPGLSSNDQQKEFISILEMHKKNGMNAVIVQVRPAADAFYPSRFEPWSKWLTGKLGQPPSPYYDPLKFMIDESHKRGMEFHAWFNPYRAVMNVDTLNIDSASLAFKNKKWFVKYDKHLYFNPGIPEARHHVTNVILDVVNRYDVDGIHFDDYFYPYKVTGLTFDDSTAFRLYGKEFTSVDDWRRHNVNMLIKDISDSLRKVKDHVRFGISPFGVWRNQEKDPLGSATRAGQTCYDDLYADVLKWMKAGWIDYVAPQIYWTIGFDRASYDVLARWWNDNSQGLPVYIGQAAYRINGNLADSTWREADQIPKQIRLNRNLTNIRGSIFFSSKSFIPNPLGICDSLRNGLYKFPALSRNTATLQREYIDYNITFAADRKAITLFWNEERNSIARSSSAKYIVYRFQEHEEINLSNARNIIAILADTNPSAMHRQFFRDEGTKKNLKYWYVITSLDKKLNESQAVFAYPVKRLNTSWKIASKKKF